MPVVIGHGLYFFLGEYVDGWCVGLLIVGVLMIAARVGTLLGDTHMAPPQQRDPDRKSVTSWVVSDTHSAIEEIAQSEDRTVSKVSEKLLEIALAVYRRQNKTGLSFQEFYARLLKDKSK